MDKEQFAIRNEILYEIKKNAWDREIMPHYGLAPDYYPRYNRIVELIEKYLDCERDDK